MVSDSQYKPIATILLSASSEKATVKNHLPEAREVGGWVGSRMPTAARDLKAAPTQAAPPPPQPTRQRLRRQAKARDSCLSMWGITFTRWSYSAVNTHSGSLRLSGSCGTTRHTHHDPDRCQQSAGARGGEGGGLTLLAMTTQLATMSTSTVLSNHGLHTHGVGGSRGGYSWPALNPRAQLPGRHAHTRAAPCQPQAPYSAVAATARDPPSPSRAPLNQSDEEGPYWVVDSHEAPRQPAVDSSRGRNLLRRRIFSCGQHRIPDHLGKREPPLAGTYHRLPVRRTAFGRHLRVCGYTKERKQLSKISPLRSGGGG